MLNYNLTQFVMKPNKPEKETSARRLLPLFPKLFYSLLLQQLPPILEQNNLKLDHKAGLSH